MDYAVSCFPIHKQDISWNADVTIAKVTRLIRLKSQSSHRSHVVYVLTQRTYAHTYINLAKRP